MGGAWPEVLSANPLPALLDWQDEALAYFIRRELLGEAVSTHETLWKLREPLRLVKKQQAGGWFVAHGLRQQCESC